MCVCVSVSVSVCLYVCIIKISEKWINQILSTSLETIFRSLFMDELLAKKNDEEIDKIIVKM